MARHQIITYVTLAIILGLQITNLVLLRRRPPTTNYILPTTTPIAASPSAELTQQLASIRDEIAKLRADQRDLTSVLGLTTASPAPTPTTMLTVDANYPSVNVFDQPFATATVVGRISPGRAYPYSDFRDNWYRITLPDATSTWVEAKYVKPL